MFIYREICNQSKEKCKYCYGEEAENNPFINLCKCSGSVASLHFQCLKTWMTSKIVEKQNDKKTVISYYINNFNCEICKDPYPLKFKYKDKYYDLIDSARPNNNFIVLEMLNHLKDSNNHKSLHVITLIEDEKIVLVKKF